MISWTQARGSLPAGPNGSNLPFLFVSVQYELKSTCEDGDFSTSGSRVLRE